MTPLDKVRSFREEHLSTENWNPLAEWGVPVGEGSSWGSGSGASLPDTWTLTAKDSPGDRVWMGLGVLTILVNAAVGGWGCWFWIQKWIDWPPQGIAEIFL